MYHIHLSNRSLAQQGDPEADTGGELPDGDGRGGQAGVSGLCLQAEDRGLQKVGNSTPVISS
jgi:hypothetical protein